MPQPTTEPLRLRIQKAIVAELEKISPDSDYFHDLRPVVNEDTSEVEVRRVWRGRFWYGDTDPLPLVSILQHPMQPEADTGSQTSGNPNQTASLEWVVQGWVEDDLDNPTDPAEYLLADVERCLATVRKNYTEEGVLGINSFVSLELGVGVVRPPDEISSKAYFWLPITLTVVRDLSDPYNDT